MHWSGVSRHTVPVALAVLALAGSASAKTACPPSFTQSTGPRGVPLVGTNGSADPIGSITYVIRDLVGNPYPGAVVILDFSACSDLRIAPDPSQPGVTVDCTTKSVRAFGDMTGAVTFRIVGSRAGGASQSPPDCMGVSADGVPLTRPIVSALDLDGRNGVDVIDLSAAYADAISGQYRPRADYDADGDSDLLDVGFLYRALVAHGSASSAAACP